MFSTDKIQLAVAILYVYIHLVIKQYRKEIAGMFYLYYMNNKNRNKFTKANRVHKTCISTDIVCCVPCLQTVKVKDTVDIKSVHTIISGAVLVGQLLALLHSEWSKLY